MNRKFLYGVLAILLSFSVTNEVWISLFQDNLIVAELESGWEEESEREFRSGEFSTDDHDFVDFGPILPSESFHNLTAFSGFVQQGNSFSLSSQNHPKLFLLYCQLRFHC